MKKTAKIYMEEHLSVESGYGINFVLGDINKLAHLCSQIDGETIDGDFAGMVTYPKKGRKVYILICPYKDGVLKESRKYISKEQYYRDTVTHETIHAVHRIFDHLGYDLSWNGTEHLAYFLSHWIGVGQDFVERSKKLDIY